MGRPSNTAERRAQIVDALVRVMATTGYAGASVAAIAREAGLTPGLVHYHFGSKEEVLLATVDRLGALVGERFVRFSKGAASPRERLFAFIAAFLERDASASPEAVACWVALGTEALTRPEVGRAYRRVVAAQIDVLIGLVGEVLAAEGGDAARAPVISSGIYAAIEGLFRLATIAPGVIPEGSASTTVRSMTEGLLS